MAVDVGFLLEKMTEGRFFFEDVGPPLSLSSQQCFVYIHLIT
jgi:hypothetical protein